MRKCIEIEAQGLRLRGVVHLPDPGAASAFEGFGVIMLHPGFLPRSAQADSAVVLADALARNGIQTVRIDLPGLGDSEGDLPEDSFTFIDMVQEGGLAKVTRECVDHIKAQLGWQRVVAGGHCGGAITAFFAQTLRRDKCLDGLLALDVIYYLIRPACPQVKDAEGKIVREAPGLRREAVRNEIRLALLNTRLGGRLQKLAQRGREFFKTVRTKRPPRSQAAPAETTLPARSPGQLPPEANLKLLNSIEQVLKSGLPILFVKADDPSKPSDFDYEEYLRARCRGKAIHETISGTDHGFISGDGKSRVSQCVLNWLNAEFRNPASQPVVLGGR